MGLSDAWSRGTGREVRSDAARRRRRDVHRARTEPRRRARRRDRTHVLDVLAAAVAACARVLRPDQSRARHPRRYAVHGHDRRPSDRDRRESRQAGVGRRAVEAGARVLAHRGAARDQGQSPRRAGRRRVRHPRLHRRVRREDRKGSLALQHRSRSRRGWTRDVAAEQRCMGAWRRVDLGDWFL